MLSLNMSEEKEKEDRGWSGAAFLLRELTNGHRIDCMSAVAMCPRRRPACSGIFLVSWHRKLMVLHYET